jgi:hypothetical protein
MYSIPSEDYCLLDNFSYSLSDNIFLEQDSISFSDGLESFNSNFNVYNNINDINNQNDLNSKKSLMFQIEKPIESLIFHIIKKDIETVETNDSLYNKKKNPINPKDRKANNYLRKKKEKKINRRKDNTDNIRTKLINKFFKYLRIDINDKLKSAKSKKFFKYFPRKMIAKYTSLIIKAKKNKTINEANLTFYDIISTNFCKDEKIENLHESNYNYNLEVLKYLEQQKDISEKIKFDLIKKMKFSEMFSAFLKSKEYQKEIKSLKEKDEKYFERFENKAREILYYFSN